MTTTTENKTPSVCSSIKELTMDKYIDCVCNGNLRILAIDDTATDAQLQQAWRRIRSDYIEASGDAQIGYFLSVSWDAETFAHVAGAVRELLRWFDYRYDPRFADTLREMGYDYPFTEESYREDIQSILTELSCEALHIKDQAANLQQQDRQGGKPTEQSYYRTIVMLQKHLGIFPNAGPMIACKQMTVYEFITYCRMYNELMTKQTPPKEDGTGY